MGLEFATRTVDEGLAHILVPEMPEPSGEHPDRLLSRAPVFYNPRMKLNRDVAVLALRAFQGSQDRRLSICEPMCGTGVRGIRLAKEVEEVRKVVMGDLSSEAVRLASHNVHLNGLSRRAAVRNLEANLLLALHSVPGERFDYIDLDPFGSPVNFLGSAARSLRDGGLLAATATDMAPLCGAHPQPCLRRYGGLPLHTEYCHEVALRLLVGALVSASARNDRATRVVFSCCVDHYVRVYAVLVQSSEEASDTFKDVGYILHCWKCLNRRVVHRIREIGDVRCEECGETMSVGGPLWIGRLAEPSFCDAMISEAERLEMNEKRLRRLLALVRSESDYPPTFFRIDSIGDLLNIPSYPLKDILEELGKAGYRATRTHFDPRGVKTEAPIREIKRVLLNYRAGTAKG